mgnify:CR=1 FL=1|jgi:nucleoside-diphosphate kinase
MMKGAHSYTFGIIKPTSFYEAGGIVSLLIKAELSIDLMICRQLTMEEAQEIYAPHKDGDFFISLCEYMCSGNVYLLRLTHPSKDAVKIWRDLMGATNPEKAKRGTIRAIYGRSLRENAVHGSDSAESATRELEILENILK